MVGDIFGADLHVISLNNPPFYFQRMNPKITDPPMQDRLHLRSDKISRNALHGISKSR
jgi:hypothetical protein